MKKKFSALCAFLLSAGAFVCLFLVVFALPVFSTGCTMVKAPDFAAFSWGLESSQMLQGLNVTVATNGTKEVLLDGVSAAQNSQKMMDGIVAIGGAVMARELELKEQHKLELQALKEAQKNAEPPPCPDGECDVKTE